MREHPNVGLARHGRIGADLSEIRGREQAPRIDPHLERSALRRDEVRRDAAHLTDVAERKEVAIARLRVGQPSLVEEQSSLEGDRFAVEARFARRFEHRFGAGRRGIDARARPEADLGGPDGIAGHLARRGKGPQHGIEQVDFEITQDLPHDEATAEVRLVRVSLADEAKAARRAERCDGV